MRRRFSRTTATAADEAGRVNRRALPENVSGLRRIPHRASRRTVIGKPRPLANSSIAGRKLRVA